MTIHASENNLGDINPPVDDIQNKDNEHDENNNDMNPYAVHLDTIHEEESDATLESNNVNLSIEEKPETNESTANTMSQMEMMKALYYKSYQEQIKKKQAICNRRNDIMRTVAKERFKNYKPKAKQYIIKTSSKFKSFVGSVNRLTSIKLNSVKNNVEIPTSHSYENVIRDVPEVNTTLKMPLPVITKSTPNLALLKDPVIPNVDVLEFRTPLGVNNLFDRENIQPVSKKPKEVNLGEIVAGVLQDVLSGKISTIENTIGKLRINFEEKNVFANVKKRNIILLNFEDDSMRPVLKIEDKYMDVIQKWYETCDLLMDIEETNASIPENITVQDVSGILFQDINYKYKEDYLNNYIPLVINNIISKRCIKDLERKYFDKPTKESIMNKIFQFSTIDPTKTNTEKNSESTEIANSNDLLKIKQIGIIVPPNLNPEYVKENNVDQSSYKISPWFNETPGSIEPRLINNYILDNPHIFKADVYNPKSIEIRPYNNVSELQPYSKDQNNNNIPFSYNEQYNCLNPNFADNSESVDEIFVECSKTSEVESIYVLINDKFLQTLTVKNPDQNVLFIIKNHSEFGFVKLFNYSTNNADIINFIEREFDKQLFNDSEEVNKKLLVTSQYIDFSNKQNDSNIIASTEETQVKKFINSKYFIDGDINNKMKASALYDIIINSNVVKIDENKQAGFRTRLSKYLKDLGLQKKRYNDGFYYYGIVEKRPTLLYNERDNKPRIDLADIIRARNEEINNIYNGEGTFNNQ